MVPLGRPPRPPDQPLFSERDLMTRVSQALRKYRDLRCSVGNLVAFSVGGGNVDIALTIRGPELDALARYTEALPSSRRWASNPTTCPSWNWARTAACPATPIR